MDVDVPGVDRWWVEACNKDNDLSVDKYLTVMWYSYDADDDD